MSWVISILVGIFAAGLVGAALSGLRIRAGWQEGNGLLARYLDRRRRARFDLQLPQVLSTMSNALRAGFSISQAFDSVVEQGEAPASEEFAILQQQLRLGMSFESALEAMASRVGSEDLSLVITAILVSRKTGGNVTEIFDKISDTIRGRLRVERKIRTLTAQGRLQGLVVSAMPLFLGVALCILKPGLMIPFLTSPIGIGCAVLTLALIVLGWLMIRKIIKIDV